MAKFLDDTGLAYFWNKIKAYINTAINQISIPTKVSDLDNDSGFINGIDVFPSGSGNVVTGLSASDDVITYTLGNASTTAVQIIRDSSTTDINTLKIHYLSQADYIDAVDQGLINANEFYITPETE